MRRLTSIISKTVSIMSSMMPRKVVGLFVLVSFLISPSLTLAVDVTPVDFSATILIDGRGAEIPLVLSESGKGFELANSQFVLQAEGGTITINQLEADFDPVILFAFGFIDSGPPSLVELITFAPLAPTLAGQYQSVVSIVGGLTDASEPADGSSVALSSLPTLVQGTIDGANLHGIGPALAFATQADRAFEYGAYSSNSLLDCANFGGVCNDFGLHLSFAGAGGGDGIALTAVHEIKAVPEPASLALLISGAGFLMMIRLKKLSVS
jgi:hypothetical protein